MSPAKEGPPSFQGRQPFSLPGVKGEGEGPIAAASLLPRALLFVLFY